MTGKRMLGPILVVMLATAACDTGSTAPDGGGNASRNGEAQGGQEINIGIFPVISPVPIMQEQKMLEDAGYTVNWIQVEGGLPAAASALAAGQLDMVHANSSSGTIIFSNEPGAAWFVGRSFINLNETVVSEASGITDISELADRRVVVSGLKTASTLFYEMGLAKEGLTPDRDQYFVAGTGPSMVDVLASGGTEVAATYVPYSSEMVRRGLGRVMFTASDALGRTEPGDGFIVSRPFAQDNPDAVEAVLKALAAAMDAIREDPAAHYESLAEFAGVAPETIERAFGGDILPPDYVPDVDALVEVATIAEENGFAPEGVSNLADFARDFANPTFAEEALSGD